MNPANLFDADNTGLSAIALIEPTHNHRENLAYGTDLHTLNKVFSRRGAVQRVMERRRTFWSKLRKASTDDSFIHGLHVFERLLSRILSIAMVIVILASLFDLGVVLFKSLSSEPVGRLTNSLTQIFGLFLNILIALELLENITAYLKKQVVQVELVIVTSLIAVSRKIIILDLEKTAGLDLIALGVTILALAVSYWLIRQAHSRGN